MDGGAWQATVHTVSKSWTRPQQLSTSTQELFKRLEKITRKISNSDFSLIAYILIFFLAKLYLGILGDVIHVILYDKGKLNFNHWKLSQRKDLDL